MRLPSSFFVVALIGIAACGSKAPPPPANVQQPSVAPSAQRGVTVAIVDGDVPIEGIVRDARTKEPLSNVTITARGEDGTSWSAHSDEAGHFAMKDPPDGTYWVDAYNGELRIETSVTARRGKTVRLELDLDEGELVHVEALPDEAQPDDGEGKPGDGDEKK